MITDEYEAVKNQFNMTDKEYEEAITNIVAITCHFSLNGNRTYWSCMLCTTKLSNKFVGRPINERMLEHYQRHLRQVKP